MNVIPLKTAVEHKCHCCTAEKDIELCELENCDYALCIYCKQKIFKENNKCPCCRREIVINIYQESSIESFSDEESSDQDFINLENHPTNMKNCNKQAMCVLNFFYKVMVFLVFTSALLCLGRLFTIITKFAPPSNFWFENFEKPILMFTIFSILGSVFILSFSFFCLGICRVLNDSLRNLFKL